LVNAQVCGPGTVVINEIDPDQGGVDMMEFVELYSSTPNCLLDGLVLVLYNGSDNASYNAIDLDGAMTDANGLYLISLPSNGLQNGADAVALITGDATDYPNDTPIPAMGLIEDAIVYGTNDNDNLVLIAGFGGPQYDDSGTTSIGRNPDGSATIVEDLVPSPMTLNAPPLAVPGITIDKRASDGTDSQTITATGTATFEIIVTNSGTVDLVNVAVTDPLSPDCNNTIGGLVVGASLTYGCTLTGVVNDFDNIAIVTGETAGGLGVMASDTSSVVVMIDTDCSITMETLSTDPREICSGETFDITASGLEEMDMTTNMEADFGINFVNFQPI